MQKCRGGGGGGCSEQTRGGSQCRWGPKRRASWKAETGMLRLRWAVDAVPACIPTCPVFLPTALLWRPSSSLCLQLQQQGMEGTCMVAIMKKPRKQKELSTTVQRGVRAVLRTSAKAGGGSAVGGGGARKRKTRGAEEGGGGAAAAAAAEGAKAAAAAQALAAMEQVQPDVDMTDVEAPPAKARRTTGRSTRLQAQALAVEQQQQQQQLEQQQASQQAAPPEGCGGTAVGGGAPVHGSSQSETGAHEGSAAVQQPASSSHTVGSQPPAAGQPVRGGSGAAHSFRSSSGAGASGVVLEGGSMGQVGGGGVAGELRGAVAAEDPSMFAHLPLLTARPVSTCSSSGLCKLCASLHRAAPPCPRPAPRPRRRLASCGCS